MLRRTVIILFCGGLCLVFLGLLFFQGVDLFNEPFVWVVEEIMPSFREDAE